MKPYFPIALDLVGHKAVVVGGNDEAAEKAERLLRAKAHVQVLWPEVGARLRALIDAGDVAWAPRRPEPADLRGARVVVLAERDPALAAELHEQGRREGFWLCAIDQPEHCDWVNVAQLEVGPIRIAISTGGTSPGLAKRLREDLHAVLAADGRFESFASRLADLRKGLMGLPDEERFRQLALAIEGFRLEIEVKYPAWESNGEGDCHP